MGKFNIGDKVVPISKSVYGSLDQSTNWKEAQKINQPFLYLNEICGSTLTCGYRTSNGDYFLELDLIPYEEKLKKGDVCYVSNESIEDARQQKTKRTFFGYLEEHTLFLTSSDTLDRVLTGFVKWKYYEKVPDKPKSINVKLTSDYTAEVFADRIVVGCQTIPISKLSEINDAVQTLLKK